MTHSRMPRPVRLLPFCFVFFVFFVVFVSTTAPEAAPAFALRDGERVLFLGDSNTQAGTYVQYLDAFLRTRFPDRRFDLLNLGLASETVSGLTETDHPFPRPDLHERLGRALAKTRPDVVVACYGTNDGIYHPFSEERLAAYQRGIRRLREAVLRAGARLVLLTPPPFDPLPIRDRVRPATAADFSYRAPFEGYDAVLERYSRWLVTQRGEGLQVVDLHAAVAGTLAACRRADPQATLSPDGIHLNPTGHWLIARALLSAWNAPAEVDSAVVDLRTGRVLAGRARDLVDEKGKTGFVWDTLLPMPADPRWDPRLAASEPDPRRLNAHRLAIRGIPGARAALYEDDQLLGEFTRAELAAGIDLSALPAFSPNRRSVELLPLVQQRERLLAAAWLAEVGHQRPGTPRSLPLPEAEPQARALDACLRTLAQPAAVNLRLTRSARP